MRGSPCLAKFCIAWPPVASDPLMRPNRTRPSADTTASRFSDYVTVQSSLAFDAGDTMQPDGELTDRFAKPFSEYA